MPFPGLYLSLLNENQAALPPDCLFARRPVEIDPLGIKRKASTFLYRVEIFFKKKCEKRLALFPFPLPDGSEI